MTARSSMLRAAWLLAAAALALPAGAEPDAGQACRQLIQGAQAILDARGGGLFGCEAIPSQTALVVNASSDELFNVVRGELFPGRRFLGYEVRRAEVTATGVVAGAKAPAIEGVPAETVSSWSRALNGRVDFDGAAERSSLAAIAPGAAGPGLAGAKPIAAQQRPPGREAPQPQPPAQKPPGREQPTPLPPSGGGNDRPPDGAPPPSGRPVPVIRVTGTPAPNWWNTRNWGTIPLWQQPLLDFGQDKWVVTERDAGGEPIRGVYTTRWFLNNVDDVHITDSGDSESFSRSAPNPVPEQTVTLINRQTVVVTRRYYRAVYDAEYVQDIFGGRWEDSFKEWEAAHAYVSRNVGTDSRSVTVYFDMDGQSLWPWESERFTVTFDGSRVGWRGDGAFEYHTVSNDGHEIELRAGRKLLTAPGAIKFEIQPSLSRLGFQIKLTDWWTDYYDDGAAETLDFYYIIRDATGIRRELYKEDQNRPRRLVTYQQSDIRKSTGSNPQPYVLSVNGPWLNRKIAPSPGRRYTVEWGFRRTNSSISNAQWVPGGVVNVSF